MRDALEAQNFMHIAGTGGFGLVSIRGISQILNNIEIDGADNNQACYAEERGRTREAYSTSENAVREFAVNSGVYAAEYGRAAEGVINSVTRSGTNSYTANCTSMIGKATGPHSTTSPPSQNILQLPSERLCRRCVYAFRKPV